MNKYLVTMGITTAAILAVEFLKKDTLPNILRTNCWRGNDDRATPYNAANDKGCYHCSYVGNKMCWSHRYFTCGCDSCEKQNTIYCYVCNCAKCVCARCKSFQDSLSSLEIENGTKTDVKISEGKE
jgi:hypothetical protein